MSQPFDPLTIPPELIVRLIKEDLKSNKLAFGLNYLGIVAEPYHSDLGTIILVFMGFTDSESDEELYTFYQEQMELITALETYSFFQQLDGLAQELYQLLMNRKG
jgi:hypothetical protein